MSRARATAVSVRRATSRRRTRPNGASSIILAALFLGFLLLSIFCWFMLSLHSPPRPSVETGHTEALHLPAGRGGRMITIYVQPAEAVVCIGLFLGSVVAPGCYLAWDAFRKRRPPR